MGLTGHREHLSVMGDPVAVVGLGNLRLRDHLGTPLSHQVVHEILREFLLGRIVFVLERRPWRGIAEVQEKTMTRMNLADIGEHRTQGLGRANTRIAHPESYPTTLDDPDPSELERTFIPGGASLPWHFPFLRMLLEPPLGDGSMRLVRNFQELSMMGDPVAVIGVGNICCFGDLPEGLIEPT